MNGIILPPKHEHESVLPSQNAPTSTVSNANVDRLLKVAPTLARQLPFVQEAMANLPPGGAGAVNALAHGETDPVELAYSGLLGEAGSQVSKLLGLPMTDLVVSTANETRAAIPNYGASTALSTARTTGGLIGNALLPGFGYPIGSTIAGYFAQESVRNGYLGDWTDARDQERQRDSVEDYGKSVSDTKDMYGRDVLSNSLTGGNSPFGLQAEYDTTMQGRLERSAGGYEGVFGTSRKSIDNSFSVAGFFKENKDRYSFGDDQDDNVGGSKGSSTGTGGGYNDGSGGVTGL